MGLLGIPNRDSQLGRYQGTGELGTGCMVSVGLPNWEILMAYISRLYAMLRIGV